MSGKLYMLTPISSPMVTRPTSPAAAGAVLDPFDSAVADGSSNRASADRDKGCVQSRMSRPGGSSQDTGPLAHQQHDQPAADEVPAASPHAAAAAQSSQPGSPSPSIKSTGSDSSSSGPASGQVEQRWCSPPCCSSCGAAKANGGSCSGCGGKFCKACVQPEQAAPGGVGARVGKAGLGGPCSNCSSLCSACKPIACSFCEPGDAQLPVRMCEACAGNCDACKRAACESCASAFVSCSSCGYATCEECQLQSQMGEREGLRVPGTAAAASRVVGGCWCAPPLRSAANVRHISSQRFQMSQLHPSVLASSMEAAGLRDADFDYVSYDMYEDPDSGTGQYNFGSRGSADLQQQLDADVLEAHHRHWAAAEGLAGLDSKTLGAVLGSIGYGLSPGNSSISSGSHVLPGSYPGAGLAAAAAATGSSSHFHQLQLRSGPVADGSVK